MFEVKITSLHEFRVFVDIIRGKDITNEELSKLSQSLDDSAAKLLAAEEANKASGV